MGYFINKELKRNSQIIFIVMVIVFSLTMFHLQGENKKLKQVYIDSLGAVAVKTIEINPELEGEIIPIITKGITEKEALKGRDTLNKYGITNELDNDIFPGLNEIIRENFIFFIFLFFILTLGILIFNYIESAIYYKKIRKVSYAAMEVIEGNYNINIDEHTEGDFSKLAVSFNLMKDAIRNNISDLKNEKEFLVKLLSDISHQLKTPLSSIIINNDIMLESDLSKESRDKFLLTNEIQLNKMNVLIKNMLKLAKLDAKALEFDMENQSLNETIHGAIDSLESKSRALNVKINLSENNEINLIHDSLWLEEAFINIIKNGIEHSIGGEININLNENPLFTRVEIEDNGEGMGEEDLPNIFKRFFRAQGSKKSDSVGIGLALSKAIIEAHSGTIEVKSELGKGTKFSITFLKI